MLSCLRRSRPLMIVTGVLVATAGFTAGSIGGYESAQAGTAVKTPTSVCNVLAGMSIPAAAIGLPTRGATVVSATLVSDTAPDNKSGEYCKVLGTIHPVGFLAPE